MAQVVHIGAATLMQGDWRDLLPENFRCDAVVTDPPYGIGVDSGMAKDSGNQRGTMATRKGTYRATNWDRQPITPDDVKRLRSMSRHQIIFGGNYFEVPPARCWLVWDKQNGGNEFADCELAWTNLDKPVRRIEWMWNGMLRAGKEERVAHPTQKPLEVMRWCIGHLPPDVASICDPYMGSGTTGCAAVSLGKQFIGVEVDPEYFDLACRRIEDAQRQPDMFVKQPEVA